MVKFIPTYVCQVCATTAKFRKFDQFACERIILLVVLQAQQVLAAVQGIQYPHSEVQSLLYCTVSSL